MKTVAGSNRRVVPGEAIEVYVDKTRERTGTVRGRSDGGRPSHQEGHQGEDADRPRDDVPMRAAHAGLIVLASGEPLCAFLRGKRSPLARPSEIAYDAPSEKPPSATRAVDRQTPEHVLERPIQEGHIVAEPGTNRLPCRAGR